MATNTTYRSATLPTKPLLPELATLAFWATTLDG